MADWLALVLIAVGIPAWLYLGVLIARDTDRHGAHGGLVGAAFVLVWPVGLLFWLRARAAKSDAERVGR